MLTNKLTTEGFFERVNARTLFFEFSVVKKRKEKEKNLGRFDEETYSYLSVKEYFADLINAGCFGRKERDIICVWQWKNSKKSLEQKEGQKEGNKQF